jgi:hypothetical protein
MRRLLCNIDVSGEDTLASCFGRDDHSCQTLFWLEAWDVSLRDILLSNTALHQS